MTKQDGQSLESAWSLLAQMSQEGDSAAYRQLLKGILPFIKMRISLLTKQPELIEDIAQEALIAIHKALPTYDPSRKFLPWLSAVVRFKAIDLLRKQSRRTKFELLDNDIFDFSSVTFCHPQTNTQYDTWLEEIKVALDSLPGKQKVSVSLLKIEGLSVKEASQRTGWSESAIKTSAHRGYVTLKNFFRKENAND